MGVAAGPVCGTFDGGAERSNLPYRSAGLHDHTVGDFRRHPLSERSVARDVDRYRGTKRREAQPAMMERDDLTVDVDGLAAQ